MEHMSQTLDNQIQEYFTNKRILITGASGYIATNLIDVLKDVDCSMIRLSRKNSLQHVDGVANIEDIQGDIRGEHIWKEVLNGTDIIYHFAAQTSAYIAEVNPFADLEANVLPMLRILEVCQKQLYKPSIIFSGTVTETGMTKVVPVNEDRKDNPITIYDLHKLMAENYLKYFSEKDIVQGVILRLPNVYGPGPKSSSKDRGILNLMIKRALSGMTLQVYGSGNQIRDYIYIDDVVCAFLVAAINIEKTNGQHFVIGSSIGFSVSDSIYLVKERVLEKTGKQIDIVNIPPPSTSFLIEERNFIADISRFTSSTGWQPKFSLNNGIDRTIDSYLT